MSSNIIKVFFALGFLANASFSITYEEAHATLVDTVNAQQKLWKAELSAYFRGKSLDTMRHMLGTKMANLPKAHISKASHFGDPSPLPASFDASKQWTKCSDVINHIRDQAGCGSCWAVAAAEMMSDRHCIASNGTQMPFISAEDLMTCCWWCGIGCGGGYPIDAVRYWSYFGVVTGGDYGSGEGCMPYMIPPGHSMKTPNCTSACLPSYGSTYAADKKFASAEYYVPANVQDIQREIMTNGPVEAAFTVYDDFYSYSSGVYFYTTGGVAGGHAVKMIGWGTENGTDYWLVNNSWNTTWGLNGQFKIRRGTNECGIEGQIVAGMAKN